MGTMLRILFQLTFFLLLALPTHAQDWVVSRVRGSAEQMENGRWVTLVRGAVVLDGQSVRTGADGRVGLARGVERVDLDPGTQIRLHEGAGKFTSVEQVSGVITADVERRNVQHFSVQTPFLAAVVKGTRFRVAVTGNAAEVEVERGVVQVQDSERSLVTDIVRGQKAEVSREQPLQVTGEGSAAVFSFDGVRVVNGTEDVPADAQGEPIEGADQQAQSAEPADEQVQPVEQAQTVESNAAAPVASTDAPGKSESAKGQANGSKAASGDNGNGKGGSKAPENKGKDGKADGSSKKAADGKASDDKGKGKGVAKGPENKGKGGKADAGSKKPANGKASGDQGKGKGVAKGSQNKGKGGKPDGGSKKPANGKDAGDQDRDKNKGKGGSKATENKGEGGKADGGSKKPADGKGAGDKDKSKGKGGSKPPENNGKAGEPDGSEKTADTKESGNSGNGKGGSKKASDTEEIGNAGEVGKPKDNEKKAQSADKADKKTSTTNSSSKK